MPRSFGILVVRVVHFWGNWGQVCHWDFLVLYAVAYPSTVGHLATWPELPRLDIRSKAFQAMGYKFPCSV